MIEIGSRRRNQPAPPSAMFDALTNPDRDPSRPWLILLDDEQRPAVVEAVRPDLVVWTSLWVKRTDLRVRFDLPAGHSGTDVRWTVLANEPVPDDVFIGHMRYRMNLLVNANLRYTFGQ